MDVGKLPSFQSSYIRTGQAPTKPKTQSKPKKKAVADEETGEKLDADEIKKRNQRYLNVLTDLHRLRDHYYAVYLSKLEEKVKNQRKEIVAREDRLKQKLLRKEEKMAKESHKFLTKLPHHKLTNDEGFLRKVPKSHYYHLTAVENLMKSRGLLRHRWEVDEFWRKAKVDHSFWKRNIPSTVSPDAITEHMLSRYSSITTHSKQEQSMTSGLDLSRPGILKKVPEEKQDEEHDASSSEAEIVIPPKPKFPKLHAFNMKLKTDYGKSLRSLVPESSSETSSITSSDEHRRRKLHHHIRADAYQLAVVNTAMTERMLKKHALIGERPNPISELSEIWCGKSDNASTVTDQTSKVSITTSGKSVKHRKRRKRMENQKQKERITTVPEENEDEIVLAETTSQPLSMEMMLAAGNLSIKDTKQSKPLWVNYAE